MDRSENSGVDSMRLGTGESKNKDWQAWLNHFPQRPDYLWVIFSQLRVPQDNEENQ